MMVLKIVALFAAVALGFTPPQGRATHHTTALRSTVDARPLGGMESLFAPRRSLDTCTLPPMVHACAAVLDADLDAAALRAGLERAVGRHGMLSRRIVGDGAPERRGPLGAPVSGDVWRNVLAPFGDDNMRIGPSTFAFAPMAGATAASVVAAALEGDGFSEDGWRAGFARALDGGRGDALFADVNGGDAFAFDLEAGPLWRCKLFEGGGEKAIVFAFDHCVSDQPSAMAVVSDVLDGARAHVAGERCPDVDLASLPTPPSLEDDILAGETSRGFVSEDLGGTGLLALDKGSAPYLFAKVSEPASLGALAASPHLPAPDERWGDGAYAAKDRRAALVFAGLDAPTVAALRSSARAAGTTVGSALAAAAARAFSRVAAAPGNVKVLQSLDMRRFAETPAPKDVLACHAGSMDLVLDAQSDFWDAARNAGSQLAEFEAKGFGPQSVRVFDWATDAMEMTRLVELEADNPYSLGRAYCCGVSNAGLYGGADGVAQMYYATSTRYAGATFQASCVTVGGALNCCFNAPEPIATRASLEAFAKAFTEEAEAAASGSPLAPPDFGRAPDDEGPNGVLAVLGGAALGLGAHAPAVANFGAAFLRAQASGAALAAPFGFWVFFATMHPLIGGAGVGLGELTWAVPGYAGLDAASQDAAGPPLAFLVASLAASNVISSTPLLRAAASGLASFALCLTISSGLAGTSGDNGSLNLALDDAPVAGAVFPGDVRGCPTYADVRQKSMDGFDVTKYTGRWYEHAYHDWTQFAEVYDTTLDIDLAADGKTWVDDFAVKGPSPAKAPRSWRGSPVANGAHYPLYGTLDPSKPGELQESGFGNVFPNYIVDVVPDGKGGYAEAIQFQCLEAGGVRVFEGINFLSRDRELAPGALDGFFARAGKAGLAKYGAVPEQMHVVEHAPADFADVDNWWQSAWRAIGVDKLLALIAADI